MREPCFDNLLYVLNGEVPGRDTLFEFFLNAPLYKKLAGNAAGDPEAPLADYRLMIHAFKNAGYDYASVKGSEFSFPAGNVETKSTKSINDGAVISDRASFESYNWMQPDDFDYSDLEKIAPEVPEGMKLIVFGPGGVLENAIGLVGYENLCYMILDEPELAQDIFDAIGSRLVRHYELAAPYESVGAMISNDDWGFKTQTMLAPEDMRRFVFPWHERIVDAIHAWKKPAILHSCGNFEEIMEDVIDGLKYDGKHSYEDGILPVEDAYDRYGTRIAILGGIDLDYVCRAEPEKIYQRSKAMLERSAQKGGYALGTGNSVPEYVPDLNYFAMVSAATGIDYSVYM